MKPYATRSAERNYDYDLAVLLYPPFASASIFMPHVKVFIGDSSDEMDSSDAYFTEDEIKTNTQEEVMQAVVACSCIITHNI
jgi:hypothetical protein